MLVVDASVLAPAIVDSGRDGQRIRARLRGESLFGPDLLRIEVTSVLRRQVTAGSLTQSQADVALDHLLDLPITVVPTAGLLRRAWEVRSNLTPYDACYVALAEGIDSPLLTADRRLARAPGLRCAVELF